jgi:hypothetical protein
LKFPPSKTGCSWDSRIFIFFESKQEVLRFSIIGKTATKGYEINSNNHPTPVETRDILSV